MPLLREIITSHQYVLYDGDYARHTLDIGQGDYDDKEIVEIASTTLGQLKIEEPDVAASIISGGEPGQDDDSDTVIVYQITGTSDRIFEVGSWQ